MFKDIQGRYESLSNRIEKLKKEARTLWYAGDRYKALRIADIIVRFSEIRLKYIYQ